MFNKKYFVLMLFRDQSKYLINKIDSHIEIITRIYVKPNEIVEFLSHETFASVHANA